METIRRKDGRKARRPQCKICSRRRSIRHGKEIERYGITHYLCLGCVQALMGTLTEREFSQRWRKKSGIRQARSAQPEG